MAGEVFAERLTRRVMDELSFFRRGIDVEALKSLAETLPLIIRSQVESSVCDRCSRLDGTVLLFSECRSCGAVWLCGECTALHRSEIAHGEV